MISDSPSIRTRHSDRFLARKVEPGDIPEIADFIGSSESTLNKGINFGDIGTEGILIEI